MIPVHAPLANHNPPQSSIRLLELKPFNDNIMQAHVWLSALKCYFIAVVLTYTATRTANTEALCQYTVVLMAGNTAR